MDGWLVLGDFDLTDQSGDTYGVSVIASGTSRGAPVPINVAVQSWLQDGSIVITQGYDNREVSIGVEFKAADLAALADAESALFAEMGKQNTLTWTPLDGYGPPSVFVVVTSEMQQDESSPVADIEETKRFVRRYNLKLTCEAFVRSADEITVPALPVSGTTTTLVDDGSATTNWAGAVDKTVTAPAVVSGAVGITTASIVGDTIITLTRTASIATSATPYLVIDWKPTTGAYVLNTRTMQAYGDGVKLAQLSNVSLSSTVIRSTFYVPAASVAVLRLEYFTRSLTGGGSNSGQPQARTFYVDNINRTDVRPSLGTTRQQSRSFVVPGSAPAPGSLAISHPSSALGDVLAYVWADPDGEADIYSPAIRQFTTIGSTTADAATVSGTRIDVNAGATGGADIPAAAIPRGTYLVLARAAAAAGSFAGGLTAATKTMVSGTDLAAEVVAPQAAAAFTTAYAVYPVCKLQLPSVEVRDLSTATVRLVLQNNAASQIYIDEIWLFNLRLGRLVWVQCGTGTAVSGGPSRNVFIDPATIDRPRPEVLRGHATDGSDAFYSGVRAWGLQRFTPPETRIFFATTNTPDADATFRFFPRWHTHAAS